MNDMRLVATHLLCGRGGGGGGENMIPKKTMYLFLFVFTAIIFLLFYCNILIKRRKEYLEKNDNFPFLFPNLNHQ